MPKRCPTCGHDNPPGATICTDCAAVLVSTCPQCAFDNPGSFRYCGNCGDSLREGVLADAPSSLGEAGWKRERSFVPEHLAEKLLAARGKFKGERRNVTVLFADLQGFTTLSEELDPEGVYDLLVATMRGFADEIHRYGGTIDKFIGDGIMALFGAPAAHENDPERALRAALSMLDFLHTLNKSIRAEYGLKLHVRIGLHAGTVIAGTVGSDLRMQYTVVGDTVNLASRLEELAEPDTILVSQAVWAATNALFEYVSRGFVTVKGRQTPVDAYQVAGMKAHPGPMRGIHGLTAPMIGRDRDLKQLRQTIEALANEGRGRVVMLTGEAGIGKTRLLAESKQVMRENHLLVLEETCRPHSTHTEYWVFQQLLQQVFCVREADDEAAKQRQLSQCLEDFFPEAYGDVLPYMQRLLDIPITDEQTAKSIRYLSPEQLRRQTFLALRKLVLAIAQEQPLVIVVDDLQWVDRASCDLLLFMSPLVKECALCLVLISRPYEGQAASMIHHLVSETCPDHYQTLPLTRLSLFDSHILLEALLKTSTLPPRVRQGIPEKAEGNPFFLEEIVRLLIEQGTIRRTNGVWQSEPDLSISELSIPPSLHALLMSRVDRLPEEPKYVLQCCAVIGPRVPYSLLRATVGAEYRAFLEQSLEELVRREFLDLEVAAEKTYTFRHTLVRETVYGMLLSPRRKEMHQRVGRGLERLFSGRLNEVVELRAFHFGKAADSHLTEELITKIRAGE